MPEVRDLDSLRPDRVEIILGGNTIDVTIIPLALTFDISDLVEEIGKKLDLKKVAENNSREQRKAFNYTVKLCALFCQWKFPEMTVDWFMENTSVDEVNVLGTAIRAAMDHAFLGVDPKN